MPILTKIKEKTKYWIDFIIIFVLSLTPLIWFPKDYLLTGHDSTYPLDIIEFFKDRLFTWRQAELFGRDYSHSMGSLMTHGIEAFFKAVGFSLYDAEKLNFVFWFLAMGLGMFYFASSFKHVFKQRYFPLLASIFYIFNFYLLALWRLGAGTTFAAYSALPLVSSFFIRTILGEVSILKASIFISLIFFFFNGGGGLSVPLYGGLLVVLTTATIYFLILSIKNDPRIIIKRVMFLAIGTLIISLGLNSYWIFPFFSFLFLNLSSGIASQGGSSGVRGWTDVVSASTSMLNLLRLQGFPDWYENSAHAYANSYLTNPLLIISSFVFAPLSYAVLFLAKKIQEKKMLLLFIIISLLSLFFAAGTHKPTGFIFVILLDNIPGFAIFRSAQYKFIPGLYFSFAILISYSLNYLIQKFDKQKLLKLGIIIFLILFYHFPFFNNNFFIWNKPLTLLVKVPQYVVNFSNWSYRNLNNQSRLLLLPRLNTTWRAEVYNWGFFSVLSLFNLFTTKPVIENLPPLTVGPNLLVNRLYNEILTNDPLIYPLAKILQVSHVLLRNDSFYNLSWVPSEDPKNYQQALSQNMGFSKIWSEGAWELYRLPLNNETKKIFAIKDLTEISDSEEAILGPIVAGSNNFVKAGDIRNKEKIFTINDLPIAGKIEALNCRSCVIEHKLIDPEVTPARLLPDSIFYFLREWKEKELRNNSIDDKSRLGNELGLSLARITELNNLIALNRKDEIIIKTGKRLDENWHKIQKSLDAFSDYNKDYDLLKIIEGYVQYERSILLKRFNDEGNLSDLVRSNLGVILSKLDGVRDIIVRSFAKYDWSVVKEYSVPTEYTSGELFLDTADLPKTEIGTPVLPERLKIDQNTFPIKSKVIFEKVSLGTFDFNRAKSIRLFFPQPRNLLSSLRQHFDYYPTYNNSCVAGDISDFSWQNEYKIRFEAKSSLPKDASLFIRLKNNRLNENISSINEKYFPPQARFSFKGADGDVETFTFSGKDGDIKATLYFCTNLSDPVRFIKALSVETLNNPILYVIPSHLSKVFSLERDIRYEKIDSTRYRIFLNQKDIPQILVFNEQFNYGWRLYEDVKSPKILPWEFTKTWFSAQIFNDTHFQIYSFANAWYINKPTSNQLILEFYPQQLFYKGGVVTIASMIFLGLYLFIKLIKNRLWK